MLLFTLIFTIFTVIKILGFLLIIVQFSKSLELEPSNRASTRLIKSYELSPLQKHYRTVLVQVQIKNVLLHFE